jgi:hypothetical protein
LDKWQERCFFWVRPKECCMILFLKQLFGDKAQACL